MTMWHPTWWKDSHASAWERVKEAVRRDWEQTKYDFDLPGGHQLNQGVLDTVKQAAHKQPIPDQDRPNPPKVIGSWDEAEVPMGYGYSARHRYGSEHPAWNEGVEQKLRAEWELGKHQTHHAWDEVKGWVRRGYDYDRRPH
jgi:hypothetical protein